jgi:hypothetical protein
MGNLTRAQSDHGQRVEGGCLCYKERQDEPQQRVAISVSPARAQGDLERCHV